MPAPVKGLRPRTTISSGGSLLLVADALERAEWRAVVGEDLVALGGGEEAAKLDRALDGDLGRRTTHAYH